MFASFKETDEEWLIHWRVIEIEIETEIEIEHRNHD